MSEYDQTFGRLRVVINDHGATQPDYYYGAAIHLASRGGGVETQHDMSVEELRSLRYLIDRALVMADAALVKQETLNLAYETEQMLQNMRRST